jgi:adenine deaminase
MDKAFTIEGNLVDIELESIYPAEVIVEGERIVNIKKLEKTNSPHYILPGFIDAHVHVESSMLIPSEFARLAVVHGTVATISDPHEIANVCGLKGVEYMIQEGRTVPFKFHFGAPSCVPATIFETAGAVIDSTDIDNLLQREDIVYLTEMMNFPGVLNHDPEVMKKLESAKKYNKPVDGHAPGLTGDAAKQYIDAGISTDHECFTKQEAVDKLQHGMKILIREGSAAKNFEALIDLLRDYPEQVMFCSDDKHPDSLVAGHINQLCERAIAKGINVFNVLKAACSNPVKHYKLKVGQLKTNDFADFIVVKDLDHFKILETYINGQLVANNGISLIPKPTSTPALVNNFHCSPKQVEDFEFTAGEFNPEDGKVPVIEALDGQLITQKVYLPVLNKNGVLVPDISNDILKIVVINRYKDAPVAKAFIRNFGLKSGAIASSVAHDSHNIVAVGVDDDNLCKAVNTVIENKGGVSCIDSTQELVLPLPVGGLMSTDDGYKVAEMYSQIDKAAKDLGSKLSAPFMTLSFMALLVIPHLKLSDLGLFDGDCFSFISKTPAASYEP